MAHRRSDMLTEQRACRRHPQRRLTRGLLVGICVSNAEEFLIVASGTGVITNTGATPMSCYWSKRFAPALRTEVKGSCSRRRITEAGGELIEPLRATPFVRLFFRERANGYVFEVIESARNRQHRSLQSRTS